MSNEIDAAAALWPEMASANSAQPARPTVSKSATAPGSSETAPKERTAAETVELFYGKQEKAPPERRVVAKTSLAKTSADHMWPGMDAANKLVSDDARAAKAEPASGEIDLESPEAIAALESLEVIQLTQSVELYAPPGVELDPVALEGFAPIVDSFGIEPEAAQQLLELHATQIMEKVENVHKENLAGFDAMKKQWRRDFHADPEIRQIGAENVQRAAKEVLKKHATPELRAYLKDFGLDDHPAMVKFLFRINQAIFAQSDRNRADASRRYQEGRRLSALWARGGG